MQVKGFIFDMDDTLLDSMAMWREVMPEFFGRYASREAVARHLEVAETMGMEEGMVLFAANNGLDISVDELKAELISMVHDRYATEIQPLPGALEFVAKVREAGYPMALCSCTELPEVLVALEAQGIDGWFDPVLSVSLGYPGKTVPDMYLAAAAAMGLAPEEVMVVEDALVAATTAKDAGFHVTGLTWPTSRHELPQMQAVADVALPDGWVGVTLEDVLGA